MSTGTQSSVVALGPLHWWDLPEVQRIEEELFGADAWSVTQFWGELARVPDSRWYTVARLEGQIVGYAGMFLTGREADVQTVAVARRQQGRGIGGRLVEAMAQEARSHGVRVLRLEVRADNAAGLAVYSRSGFQPDGRRRDYYGPGRDAVLMSRRLSGGDDG